MIKSIVFVVPEANAQTNNAEQKQQTNGDNSGSAAQKKKNKKRRNRKNKNKSGEAKLALEDIIDSTKTGAQFPLLAVCITPVPFATTKFLFKTKHSRSLHE